MADKKGILKLFISEHCEPCQEIKELVGKGQFLINGESGDIELIDLESEEGFKMLEKYDLEGIPQAISSEGKICSIKIDEEDDTVLFVCQ